MKRLVDLVPGPGVVATQFIILEKGQVRARRGAGPRPARGLPRS